MSGSRPADVQAAFCAVLVDEWVRSGVTEAVLAPGSRSTPLVLALDADPRLRVHVVLDERSAGFVALGIGLATGRPVVVATTSGTAAVELHAAVVEASHAGVPLIAVTADRPAELHQVGAPQTVEQDGLFGPAVRWFVSPGVPDPAAARSWRSLGARAAAVASGAGSPGGPGPVHVNLAFREPLVGSPVGVAVPGGRSGGRPWHQRWDGSSAAVPASVVQRLVAEAGGRGLVVAGAGAGDSATLVATARRLGWPLLADPRSGCRLPVEPVVAAADALLRVPEVARWRPEVVLRVGAPWASKVLGQWLAAISPDVPQVLVDPWSRWTDPDRTAGDVVAADPTALAAAVLAEVGDGEAAGSDWVARWVEAEAAAQAALDHDLSGSGPLAMSEPAVARAVAARLSDDAVLVVSSSMPVRDVEWYAGPRFGSTVLSNRGANGIDGVVSTAVGVAIGGQAPVVALVGDLAFLYDTAGLLAGRSDAAAAVTIMVVDNDGGGIFSFLSQAQELPLALFERYWGTPHGVDLGAVAAAYGAHVASLDCRDDLEEFVEGARTPGMRVGIVRSTRPHNVTVHDQLHQAVASVVRAVL